MAAALFHGRCETAAWRIQESFRGRRKRRLGTHGENNETPPGEGKDSKGHDADGSDDASGQASCSPKTPEDEPDKPNSSEVNRSHMYLAAFIALFSCIIFFMRQIRKLFGSEDESDDLVQEVGNHVLDETGAQSFGGTGANTAHGGATGGAPGGNPP